MESPCRSLMSRNCRISGVSEGRTLTSDGVPRASDSLESGGVATVIHLVRHGEVYNPDNIRYGQIPGFGLSPRGVAQARAAGAYLRGLGAPIDALVSSPLERAVQTATLLEIELGLHGFERDERLIEAPNRFDGHKRTAQLYPWNWLALRDPFTPSW